MQVERRRWNRAALAARYEAGESFTDIATTLGVDPETVRRTVGPLVTARPPGRPKKPVPRPRRRLDPKISWEANVVKALRELKDYGGLDFDRAWSSVMQDFRPSGRMAATGSSGTLFDEFGDPELSILEFFKLVCADAWFDRVREPGSGLGPRLCHFSLELLGNYGDESGYAGMVNQTRAA